MDRIEKVLQWKELLNLTNPATSIRGNEIKLELFRSLEPDNDADDIAVEAVDWQEIATFPYQKINERRSR